MFFDADGIPGLVDLHAGCANLHQSCFLGVSISKVAIEGAESDINQGLNHFSKRFTLLPNPALVASLTLKSDNLIIIIRVLPQCDGVYADYTRSKSTLVFWVHRRPLI